MSDDGIRPEWAEDIRAKRLRRCWTQNDLAKQLELAADARTCAGLPGRSSIIREIRFHEAGAHRPGPVYAELYRRVWALHPEPTTQQEPEPISDPLVLAWTVGRLGQRMDRRTLLQLAATTTAGVALDPAQRLMLALAGDHRPDDATITYLEDRTKGFHRLEEHVPGKTLYPALVTHLNEVSALLEAGPSEPHRRRLAIVAGESAVLAAWFAWEAGDGLSAATHARLAGFASNRAEDPPIAACMGGYRTYMTGGDRKRSVRLAAHALDQIGDSDPATRAWLLGRHAEEAALLGDQAGALNSIREAEDVYAGAEITVRPWTCFLDPGRFASMSLAVYSRLRRPDDAARAMDEIELHLGPGTEIKKLCVVQAEMALTQYRLGEVSEAVNLARSALDATTAMAHPLGWDRLDTVTAEFAGSRDQTVREFRAEYAASRPTAKQPSLP
ncbi:XRE family transcriptional regulator [Actinocorallia longicatena]|uniref:XRE family transcriptional regulator n=1 Tax=Actinocorallia longicatena TaxID=111803 RepID=A0ABP6QLD9_9ACTN